jgi:hypothetical protein
MIIKESPIVGSDKTYAEQRKCRLQDAVDDYMQDDKVTILEFYHDLKDCLQDIISYHTTSKERAEGALQLVLGYRPVDGLDDDTDPVEVTRELNNIPSRY